MEKLLDYILGVDESEFGTLGKLLKKQATTNLSQEEMKIVRSHSALLGKYDEHFTQSVKDIQLMNSPKVATMSFFHWFKMSTLSREWVEANMRVKFLAEVFINMDDFDHHWEEIGALNRNKICLIHYSYAKDKTKIIDQDIGGDSGEYDWLSDAKLNRFRKKLGGKIITTYYHDGRKEFLRKRGPYYEEYLTNLRSSN